MNHQSIRTFIGLPVKSPLTQSLEQARKKLRVSADKLDISVKWSKPEQFHVTLKFLGETKEEDCGFILDKLKEIAKEHKPISLKVRNLGSFPEWQHARVIWAGVQNSKNLSHLQNDIELAMEGLGFPEESREYIPHITLGRLRKSRAVKNLLSPFIRSSFGSIDVTKMVLYRSDFQGAFPVYTPLGEVELCGDFYGE